MRKPLAVLAVSLSLLLMSAFSDTLSPVASACSVAAPSPDLKFVRFSGKAIKHELLTDGDSPTYRWTFVISKWDKTSQGKKRKRGSQINVTVTEVRPPDAPTTTLLEGAVQNSCAGVRFGVSTVFAENKSYDVTAPEDQQLPGSYFLSYYVGLLYPSRTK